MENMWFFPLVGSRIRGHRYSTPPGKKSQLLNVFLPFGVQMQSILDHSKVVISFWLDWASVAGVVSAQDFGPVYMPTYCTSIATLRLVAPPQGAAHPIAGSASIPRPMVSGHCPTKAVTCHVTISHPSDKSCFSGDYLTRGHEREFPEKFVCCVTITRCC